LYFEPALTLLIGIFLIFFIKARSERRKKILQNCKEAKGIIVDQEIESNKNGGKLYYPVIRFKVDDDWVTKKHTDGQFPAKYSTNQEVIIQYSLNDPNEFLIKSNQINWIELVILSLGIGFLLYSFFLFIRFNSLNHVELLPARSL
jgi:hypothetical protein